MFRIPHWVLFIRIFCLRIWFKHLFEFSCSIVRFRYTHTYQKLYLDYNIILFNICFKCMSLNNLIIRSFTCFTKITCTIHPSPKMFSRSNNIIWNVIQRFHKLSRGWCSSKIWMLIICFYLE